MENGRLNLSWSYKLVNWYDQVKRDLPWRKTKDPYAIWVSEVMLQQTQVVTVIPYYQRFMERFPNLRVLAQAPLNEVLELWRGLGYYSRARHLWEGARYIVDILDGEMPGCYTSLLKIPGVGEYTAGAISSIAYQECVPAVDGNVKRVLSRLLRWEEDVDKAKSRRAFLEYLNQWQPKDRPGDFNQAMMELGATVCTPKNPKCEQCPLQEDCQAFLVGSPLAFPVKKSKEKIKEVIRPTLILFQKGKVLMKRRPPEGLLANLWEFPGEEVLVQDPASSLDHIGMTAAEETLKYDVSSEETVKSLSSRETIDSEGTIIDHETKNAKGELEKLHKGITGDIPWWDIYQKQVSDHSYDEAVKELLRQNPCTEGPVIHTFSHRRWKIYWMVLDLSAASTKQNSEHQVELRWFDVSQLETIAMPVAFQKVWNIVKKRF